MHLTDPDQAVEFVERTGIDALAVAIGTSHGAYKFTKPPDGAVLAMHLIQEIHERLPDTHLVMHGSSSVPKDLVDEINRYGGEIAQTWAYRWRRSNAASSMVCGRSMSTPTLGSR